MRRAAEQYGAAALSIGGGVDKYHIEATYQTGRACPVQSSIYELDTGRVVLTGIVFDDQFSTTAESLIMEVPGVSSVDNQLRVLRHTMLSP